jgi:hypothetical protein
MKVQVALLGRFKQARLTVPLASFCELSVMLKLVDCPGETVAEVGAMLALKSACKTTSVADAEFVREPAVPTRLNWYVPGVTFCV